MGRKENSLQNFTNNPFLHTGREKKSHCKNLLQPISGYGKGKKAHGKNYYKHICAFGQV
jgi:hypothetical protein